MRNHTNVRFTGNIGNSLIEAISKNLGISFGAAKDKIKARMQESVSVIIENYHVSIYEGHLTHTEKGDTSDSHCGTTVFDFGGEEQVD